MNTQATQKISSARSIRKTDPEDYDLVILGGGTGSTVAAWTFASEGRRVAVIDRKYIGGSCPNIACQAKTSFTVRRSRPTFVEAKNLASTTTVSPLTWWVSANANARW